MIGAPGNNTRAMRRPHCKGSTIIKPITTATTAAAINNQRRTNRHGNNCRTSNAVNRPAVTDCECDRNAAESTEAGSIAEDAIAANGFGSADEFEPAETGVEPKPTAERTSSPNSGCRVST